MQGGLSIERMCQLARVSRAGFYRFLQERLPREEDTEVRLAIQQVALEHSRRYGYRRVTAELKRRRMLVNHKQVARIMREDNLLAVQPKAFVCTTDSDHPLEVYLNLARRMQLNGIDQLWVADITYIRLQAEFVYLAVILDGYSRMVVGWKLDRTLTSRLAVDALQLAIEMRHPLAGLVHHSDRGVQYASAEYIAILTQHEMVPSMSRPANPYDNASRESIFKTLKREEIYANKYEDLRICRVTSRSSSSGTTIGNVCVPLSVTARPMSSNLKPIRKAQQSCSLLHCYFRRNTAESFNSAGKVRDSNAVPSPHPYPAWRINVMTSTTEPRLNLYEPRAVSREGFRIVNAAGVHAGIKF
jgi:transposase InsO family protein